MQPAFVFSGNGSQWTAMGRQLIEDEPGFARTIAEVDAHLQAAFARHAVLRTPILVQNPSTLEVLCGRASDDCLEFTEIAQPALFAIQAGLTQALRERGVDAGVVCGHSVGELAAAWACGGLTLAQAAEVVVVRSLQQARVKGAGQMTAVALAGEEMDHLLHQCEDMFARLTVAGYNSPRSCTVAGSPAELVRLESELSRRRVGYKRLRLDYAFHSAAMDPIREDLLNILSDDRFAPTSGERVVPFYSTVTGARSEVASLDAEYWWRNVREPVRMAPAVAAIIGLGCRVFVEISPHPILGGYLQECWDAAAPAPGEAEAVQILAAAQRGKAGSERLDEIAGRLRSQLR